MEFSLNILSVFQLSSIVMKFIQCIARENWFLNQNCHVTRSRKCGIFWYFKHFHFSESWKLYFHQTQWKVTVYDGYVPKKLQPKELVTVQWILLECQSSAFWQSLVNSERVWTCPGVGGGQGPVQKGAWDRSPVQRGMQSGGAVQRPHSLEQKQNGRHTRLKTLLLPLPWRAVIKPRMIAHTLHFLLSAFISAQMLQLRVV